MRSYRLLKFRLKTLTNIQLNYCYNISKITAVVGKFISKYLYVRAKCTTALLKGTRYLLLSHSEFKSRAYHVVNRIWGFTPKIKLSSK